MTWINYGSKSVKEIYYTTEWFATQWPCPSWFHVPTKDEWKAVYDAWVSLWQWSGSSWDWMRVKLKMPFSGDRYRSTSNVRNQGSYGYYWSSTVYSADYAYRLYFNSSSLVPQNWSRQADGFSVRAFKNLPLKPTASWTTIYAWSNWAWIYHNASEWVISISSDWQTWITIADKNLWATTVYNDWDTLSEANCWYYYQWWNNYGFPWTWTVTNSSTKVDASSYWPWNYYNSSTFITVGSSPYNWSSVQNDNLRWWVTWNVNISKVTPIKAVYYWSKKIRPAIQIQTYSIDFTTATSSKVTADWWVWPSFSVSSSWIKNCIWLVKPFDLSKATKITINSVCWVVSWSWNGAVYVWLWDKNAAPEPWYQIVYSWHNSWTYSWWWIANTGYNYANWPYMTHDAVSTWNYTDNTVYDLENKTVTMTGTKWTKTATLSNSEINSIRSYQWLYIWLDGSQSVRSVSITIESS